MRPSLSGFFRVMKGFFDGHIQLCESLRQGAGVLPDDAQDRPNYFPAHQHLAEVYLHKAQFEEAIDVLERAVEISKGASTVRGRLGYAYAVPAREDEARKILAGLQEDSKQRYVPPVAFAMVHCGLGEKNEAVRWLERAYEERAGGIASLKVRPVWSDLHSEPGF